MNTTELMQQYNRLVKPAYKAISLDSFETWLNESKRIAITENGEIISCIEIPGNETLSGHVEIVEYEKS